MLEKAGIPGIAIITDVFDSTAKEMAELWGVPDFRFVMMPHPLASLTEEGVDLSRSDASESGRPFVEPQKLQEKANAAAVPKNGQGAQSTHLAQVCRQGFDLPLGA